MKFFIIILLFGLVIGQELKVVTDSDSGGPAVVLFFDDGYYSAYQYAYPLLKKYEMTASLGIIASYVKEIAANPNRGPNSFMIKREIQEMIDSLSVEIASHSVTHARLIDLEDTMLIKYELSVSKEILESLFNQKVITFVYPYGRYDDRIVRMTKEAGYKIGRTCDFGEPNFWIARYKVPIREVRDTMSIKEIIGHIKRHDETILVFHRIVPNPQVFTEYSVSRLDSLLSVLKTMRIPIHTLQGLYEYWLKNTLQKAILERGLLDRKNWENLLFQEVDIDQTRSDSRF